MSVDTEEIRRRVIEWHLKHRDVASFRVENNEGSVRVTLQVGDCIAELKGDCEYVENILRSAADKIRNEIIYKGNDE